MSESIQEPSPKIPSDSQMVETPVMDGSESSAVQIPDTMVSHFEPVQKAEVSSTPTDNQESVDIATPVRRGPSKLARITASVLATVGLGIGTVGTAHAESSSANGNATSAEAKSNKQSSTQSSKETLKPLKDSLSPPPVVVQTDDPLEFAKQQFNNYVNGVNAGTLNSVYEKYVHAYVANEKGEIANNLRTEAKAIATLVGSYGKQNAEKTLDVEVDASSVDFQPNIRRETVTRTYSITNTDPSIGQTGSDVTEVYKEVDHLVAVPKKIGKKMGWAVSDDSSVVSKDLISKTTVPHVAYKDS